MPFVLGLSVRRRAVDIRPGRRDGELAEGLQKGAERDSRRTTLAAALDGPQPLGLSGFSRNTASLEREPGHLQQADEESQPRPEPVVAGSRRWSSACRSGGAAPAPSTLVASSTSATGCSASTVSVATRGRTPGSLRGLRGGPEDRQRRASESELRSIPAPGLLPSFGLAGADWRRGAGLAKSRPRHQSRLTGRV